MLTVTGKSVGSRKPLFEGFSVPPPDDTGDGDELRLRDLIGHVVRQEVARFKRRQAGLQFDRVLTERQIEQGVDRGRVSPEGKPRDQNVDPEHAVAAALQAFEDGLFLVVIDEQEFRDLDAPVRLQSDSRLTFIRMTFLAGA